MLVNLSKSNTSSIQRKSYTQKRTFLRAFLTKENSKVRKRRRRERRKFCNFLWYQCKKPVKAGLIRHQIKVMNQNQSRFWCPHESKSQIKVIIVQPINQSHKSKSKFSTVKMGSQNQSHQPTTAPPLPLHPLSP